MGLFDSIGDTSVSGDFASYGDVSMSLPSIPSAQDLFPTPSFLTDGQSLVDSRSNTSFWNFDQAKVLSSLQDVLGSVAQAGVKSGIQFAGDAINRNANSPNANVSSFFRNFQSTQTGAQIQAASYATRVQNFFANPIVWFVIAGTGLLFFMSRR